MSSVTIFTRAQIAILLLSLHFFLMQWPKCCDKHGDKDEDNSLKNLNNADCFVSNLGHLFGGGGSNNYAEMQSMYSTVPANWVSAV